MKLAERVIQFIIFLGLLVPLYSPIKVQAAPQVTWWELQSVDTVKYSRDLAREKAKDPAFEQTIDQQVKEIAATGATHVALGTPYNEEFVPFIKKWISAARKYGLHVWFRGNLPGWEGWFDYPKIDRDEHIKLTEKFILANGELFAEGDIFSSCPECENGGPGDPRHTGDTEGFRKFLIEEYAVMRDAFRKIDKNVIYNYFPLNGDVARLVMDQKTTKALGGIVVIDHYVADPQQLADDIRQIAKQSGGKVVLGEFGAPIPDIHGSLSETQQAEWLDTALLALQEEKELIGINYWTGRGGSSHLWNDDNSPRKAVAILSSYFTPPILSGMVLNELNQPLAECKIELSGRTVLTDKQGLFFLPQVKKAQTLSISKKNYETYTKIVRKDEGEISVILKRAKPSLWFILAVWWKNLFRH